MNLKPLPSALAAVIVLTVIAVTQNATVGAAGAQEKESSRSRLHAHFDWAKVRLDEMDAALALWDSKAAELNTDARAKADSGLADMRARRDAFRETIKKEAEMREAEWKRAKAAREDDWKAFEASAQKYINDTGEQVDQQKAAFRARADAQRNAWQKAIDKLEDDAAKSTAENKAKADAAIKQMKADAEAAKAKLDKLKTASDQSWSALAKALAETREAFDHANQTAHEAFAK